VLQTGGKSDVFSFAQIFESKHSDKGPRIFVTANRLIARIDLGISFSHTREFPQESAGLALVVLMSCWAPRSNENCWPGSPEKRSPEPRGVLNIHSMGPQNSNGSEFWYHNL